MLPNGRKTDSGNLYMLDRDWKIVSKISVPIELGQIDTYGLEDKEEVFGTGNLSIEFKAENGLFVKRIFEQTSCGAKIYYEASCIYDSMFFYAAQLLAETLEKIGCVCIHVKYETIEDANPPWMNCRFIATGIMWNTNNWRKMHGLPMIPRKMLRTRKNRQERGFNYD